MVLTYTEIEQQKNTKIFIFFIITILFYFITAFVIATVIKIFFVFYLELSESSFKISPFLSLRHTLIIVLVALLAGSIHIIYSLKNAAVLIQKNLRTYSLDLDDSYHKKFKTILEEVNVATGNKYNIKPVILPSASLNAFAISGTNRSAILGITEGLLAKLNRQQLQAVIAHEVAHIVSGDSYQTTVGCALFGIYASLLNGIRSTLRESRNVVRSYRRGTGGVGAALILLFIVYITLKVMQFFYLLIRLFISRDRELRADAIAVRLTRDPISLAEALFLISKGWRGIGSIDKNLENLFIMNPLRNACDEKEGFWANLWSTHPPIKKRLKILTSMAHINLENIERAVKTKQAMRERLKEADKDRKQPLWLIRNDKNQWQGPFNIEQIMALKWVRPDTWIKPQGQDRICQIKDEVLLAAAFNAKLSKHNTSSLTCPICHKPLIIEDYEGTKIHRCLFCKGTLVKTNRIRRIIAREEKGFSEKIKRQAEIMRKEALIAFANKEKSKIKENSLINCPQCQSQMLRTFYSGAYPVEIDKCLNCDIVWFDKDELEILQYLIENKAAI